MGTLTVTAKIDGTDYGVVASCDKGAINSFAAVSFGAYDSDTAHFDIRNIKVGTGGAGSSDLFAPALADLSEFTGVFGNDGSIAASGGVLSVDAASGDHYAYLIFGVAETGIVYVEFQLRVRTGDGSPDYFDIWDDATAVSVDAGNLDGIFFNNTGQWSGDGCAGLPYGSGPSGSPVWDTLDLAYSWSGAPPPPPVPAFHIAS